jgi:hypothetical protein
MAVYSIKQRVVGTILVRVFDFSTTLDPVAMICSALIEPSLSHSSNLSRDNGEIRRRTLTRVCNRVVARVRVRDITPFALISFERPPLLKGKD